MLAYARVCGPVCIRYRPGETNYLYGYKYNYIYVCLLTANDFHVKQILVIIFGGIFRHMLLA